MASISRSELHLHLIAETEIYLSQKNPQNETSELLFVCLGKKRVNKDITLPKEQKINRAFLECVKTAVQGGAQKMMDARLKEPSDSQKEEIKWLTEWFNEPGRIFTDPIISKE